jgi:hypothetical protein
MPLSADWQPLPYRQISWRITDMRNSMCTDDGHPCSTDWVRHQTQRKRDSDTPPADKSRKQKWTSSEVQISYSQTWRRSRSDVRRKAKVSRPQHRLSEHRSAVGSASANGAILAWLRPGYVVQRTEHILVVGDGPGTVVDLVVALDLAALAQVRPQN